MRPPTLWQIVDARGVFNTIQGAQAALRSKPPRDEMPWIADFEWFESAFPAHTINGTSGPGTPR